MDYPKRRFVLCDQPEGWGTLGDYQLGRKLNLPPSIHSAFLVPESWGSVWEYLQKNGWSSEIPSSREAFLKELRTIRVQNHTREKTEIHSTPDSTIIFLRRGMSLDSRCRTTPLRVYLGIYNACNLECTYCCASATKSRPGYLTVEEVDAIAQHFYDLGVLEVRLGESGEPTQHPDFMEIVKTLKKRGLFVSLNTNGVMSEEIREFVASSGNIDLLIQSLDGIGEAHDQNRGKGSFQEALKTIQAAFGRLKIRFNYVLNSQTSKSLEELAGLAYQYGAEIFILPMRPAGRGAEIFERYLEGLSYKDIILRMQRLRENYPGLVIHSTYDVFSLGGDQLVDHAGSCPAGVEGCCISPEVEDRKEKPARIRMFGCTFMADIIEVESGTTQIRRPFVACVFDNVDDLRARFFDVWQEGFEVFRGPVYRDDTCMKCQMLKERRCTGHCAAIGYYRKLHPDFDPSIYCAIGALKHYHAGRRQCKPL